MLQTRGHAAVAVALTALLPACTARQTFRDVAGETAKIDSVIRSNIRWALNKDTTRADGEHTEQERDLTMYRHTESAVHASLDVGGLRVCTDLEFVSYMDAARTAPMPMRAYVARREPRI